MFSLPLVFHRKFIEKENRFFLFLIYADKKAKVSYGIERLGIVWKKIKTTLKNTFVINEKSIIEQIIDKVVSKEDAAQILKEATSEATAKQ